LIKAALAAEPNPPASAAIAIVATSLFILMSFSSVSFFERIRQITQSVANLEARLEPKILSYLNQHLFKNLGNRPPCL
jgi:predicted PurR-regulated permease PerM